LSRPRGKSLVFYSCFFFSSGLRTAEDCSRFFARLLPLPSSASLLPASTSCGSRRRLDVVRNTSSRSFLPTGYNLARYIFFSCGHRTSLQVPIFSGFSPPNDSATRFLLGEKAVIAGVAGHYSDPDDCFFGLFRVFVCATS